MAIKASAPMTIMDITDAYTVYLTCPTYTFPGTTNAAKAGSCSTTVIATRAGETMDTVVGTITKPSGVSVSTAKNSDGKSTDLTVSVTTSVTAPGKVTIPVTVNGEAEFTLEFAYGIAFTGAQGEQGEQGPQGEQGNTGPQGPQGNPGDPGADAIVMVITSSNGTIFKNAAIDTTLTAHVYKGGVELTSAQIAALGTVKWYKDGSSAAAGTGLTFKVTAASVNTTMNILAQLEG